MKFPRTSRARFFARQSLTPAVQTVFAECVLASPASFVLHSLLWLHPSLRPSSRPAFPLSPLVSQASGRRLRELHLSQTPGLNQNRTQKKREKRLSFYRVCCQSSADLRPMGHACFHTQTRTPPPLSLASIYYSFLQQTLCEQFRICQVFC